MKIEIDLLPHQKKVFESQNYVTAMSCGIGSGKTYTAALVAIISLLQGKRILMVYPTYQMMRDVIGIQIKDILNKYQIDYKYNKAEQKFTVSGGGLMFVRSGESPDDINGLTAIDVCIFDECRLIPEIAYTYAISRQRAVPNPKIYLFGTGCSKRHWFAREALDKNSTWINASVKDNIKYNGEEYVNRMLKMYENMEPYFIDRELYGLFVDNDEASLFREIYTNVKYLPGKLHGGMDLAINGGADYSAISVFEGNRLIFLQKRKTLGMESAQNWLNEVRQLTGCDDFHYDHTGLGNDLWLVGAKPVHFGNPAPYPYINIRVQMYFELKKLLTKGICFYDNNIKETFDTQVRPELEVTKTIDKLGRNIQLIPKEKIIDELKHSPDLTDSLVLAAFNMSFSHIYDTYSEEVINANFNYDVANDNL